MRVLTLVLSLLLVAACGEKQAMSSGDSVPDATPVRPPNIVFILVDDMGFSDVGFNGSEIATPNLDAMAASGLRLDRNYVYAICSPTRAALLSGRSPLDFGINGPMSDDSSLPLSLRLLPEYLKDLGYQTALVGKWHLGLGDRAYFPIARGFDYHYGFLGGWVDFYTHVYTDGLDWQRNGSSLREDGHATDLLTADAKRVIAARDTDKPLFLYLAYNAPHTPLQYVPENSGLNDGIKPADRALYAEMVTHTDAGIGELIVTLEQEGILDETLIIFSSDNGGSLRAGASNGDLSGGKGSTQEGGTRVPGLVWWPGRIEGGRVMQQMLAVHDWLPTLLEAVGGDPLAVEDAHGQSMWAAILKGEQVQRLPTTVGVRNSIAVFDYPWKLLDHTTRGPNGMRSTKLFNVLEDPSEANDLSASHPQRVAELQEHLDAIPAVPSRASTKPPPESLFRNSDGGWNFDVRIAESREPWAESASNKVER